MGWSTECKLNGLQSVESSWKKKVTREFAFGGYKYNTESLSSQPLSGSPSLLPHSPCCLSLDFLLGFFCFDPSPKSWESWSMDWNLWECMVKIILPSSGWSHHSLTEIKKKNNAGLWTGVNAHCLCLEITAASDYDGKEDNSSKYSSCFWFLLRDQDS